MIQIWGYKHNRNPRGSGLGGLGLGGGGLAASSIGGHWNKTNFTVFPAYQLAGKRSYGPERMYESLTLTRRRAGWKGTGWRRDWACCRHN